MFLKSPLYNAPALFYKLAEFWNLATFTFVIRNHFGQFIFIVTRYTIGQHFIIFCDVVLKIDNYQRFAFHTVLPLKISICFTDIIEYLLNDFNQLYEFTQK